MYCHWGIGIDIQILICLNEPTPGIASPGKGMVQKWFTFQTSSHWDDLTTSIFYQTGPRNWYHRMTMLRQNVQEACGFWKWCAEQFFEWPHYQARLRKGAVMIASQSMQIVYGMDWDGLYMGCVSLQNAQRFRVGNEYELTIHLGPTSPTHKVSQ